MPYYAHSLGDRGGILSVNFEPDVSCLELSAPVAMQLLEELFENGFPLTGVFPGQGAGVFVCLDPQVGAA